MIEWGARFLVIVTLSGAKRPRAKRIGRQADP